MKLISPLTNTHKKGFFGDYESKNKDELIKITEVKNIIICQIVKFKNSSFDISKVNIDNLTFPTPLKCSFNTSTRILWMGPDNWLITSNNLKLIENIKSQFNENDFAFTDLSHSRTIIEMEGDLVDEVIKKGCPLNINNLTQGDCMNSIFQGANITFDFISAKPKKVRIYGLRSFSESLYHSVTDSCLEYGYEAK